MKALVVGADFRPKYVQYWFEHAAPRYLQLVSASSHGTKRLESENLFSLSVPLIPLGAQDKFIEQIDRIRTAATRSLDRQRVILAMKRQFLSEHLAVL